LFALNETTGSLSTNKSLVGHSGTYRFTVEATDHGVPERRVSLTRVVITVLATNQRAPRWIWPAGNNQTIEVLENQYVGLVVTDKPYAVDDDDGPSGKITYGFYDNRFVKETPEFTINPITGVISAKVIFDREEKDTYTLLLVARDNGQPPLQSNRYLTVKVLDVNDNPPSFPTFQNGSTIPVTFFVPEGVKDYFVGQVNATDKDTGRYADIYYYIDGGNFNNSFKIDNRTGRIVTNKALDRETISKFVLTVRVTNNLNDDNVINVNEEPYPNPTYVMVTIIVTDTNDNGPIFTLNEYYAFVPLRAPFWYLVTDEISATDKDGGSNGNVTFRIDQTIVSKEDTNIIYTVDNAMTIGLLNATVYTISLMDNYKDVRFDMVIDASDSGEIPRSMKSNLKVWVADETNEIVLLIKQPPYWVRRYKEKIIQLITSIVGAKTVFIDESEIRFHQVGDYVNEKWTDVVIYVVDNKTNFLMDGKAVAATLKGKLTGDEKGAFALLHVADAQPGVAAASTGGGVDWGALAGAIAALLALLLLLLLLLCCCLPCCAKCCGGCCAPVGAGAGKEKLAAVSAGAGTGAGYGYGAGSAYGYDSFNNQAFEFDELHSTGGVVAVAGGGAGGYSHEERIEREQFEFASMERSGVEQAVEAADEVDANYTIVAGLAGGEQGAAAAQGTDEYTIVAGLAGGEHGGQAQIAESAFVGTIHATTAGGTSTMRSGGSSNGGVTIRTGQSSMNHVDSGPAASVYSESIYSSRDGSAYGVPVGTAGFTIQTTETRMAAPPPVAGFTIQTTETTRAAPPPTAGFTIQTTETQRAAPPPQTAGFTIQTTETQRAAPPPQTAGFTIQTTEKVTSSQPPPPPPQPTGQSWHSGSLTFRPEVGSPVPQHGMTVHTEEVVQQHAPPMVQSPNGTLHSGSLTFRADDLPSQRSAGGTMHTGSVTIRPEDLPDAHLAGVHAPLTGVHTTTTYGRSTVHPDDHVRTGTMVSGGSNTVRTGTMQSNGRANSFTHSGSGGPYTSVENGFTVVHPQ
ncbi:cadherin-87A-like, partial [Lingula anatina]|uniref:Cadherin-87A-like n=1 Tax=Lingula anatina TaxID=7574 RepID=A0A1S3I8Q7_LINAN